MSFFSRLKEKILGKSVKQQEKYIAGLDKARTTFSDKLNALVARYRSVDDDYFDELEQILIEADVGVHEVIGIINATKAQVKLENITDPKEINDIVIDKIFVSYASSDELESEVNFAKEGPTVILMVGVNGVGKTTTIAKLTHRYLNMGKKVLLAAGDTFRAGATEQLKVWGERLGVEVVEGKLGGDPASVMFDAARIA